MSKQIKLNEADTLARSTLIEGCRKALSAQRAGEKASAMILRAAYEADNATDVVQSLYDDVRANRDRLGQSLGERKERDGEDGTETYYVIGNYLRGMISVAFGGVQANSKPGAKELGIALVETDEDGNVETDKDGKPKMRPYSKVRSEVQAARKEADEVAADEELSDDDRLVRDCADMLRKAADAVAEIKPDQKGAKSILDRLSDADDGVAAMLRYWTTGEGKPVATEADAAAKIAEAAKPKRTRKATRKKAAA